MEEINLDPMAVVQAQSRRIMALTSENVQLEAAIVMYQAQLAEQEANPLVAVEDVTDEVVRAEITS